MNDWNFSGECFKITSFDYTKDFSGNISIRGMSKRRDNISGQLIELSAYVGKDLWENFVSSMKLYSKINIGGHLEQWVNETSSGKMKTKIAFVVDEISYSEKN